VHSVSHHFSSSRIRSADLPSHHVLFFHRLKNLSLLGGGDLCLIENWTFQCRYSSLAFGDELTLTAALTRLQEIYEHMEINCLTAIVEVAEMMFATGDVTVTAH
jgi:hypothetical protein